MGYIKVFPWDTTTTTQGNIENTNRLNDASNMMSPPSQHSQQHDLQPWYSYPAHAGPIYAIASSVRNAHHPRSSSSSSSPKIATGGSDAVVGIWDVSTMTCTSTIASRTKFIRALAFSHPNHHHDTSTTTTTEPLILAIATEEDAIELIDCSNHDGNGSSRSIGCANLSNSTNSTGGRRSMNAGPTAGVEDLCFHPTIPNLLACARTSDLVTSSGISSSVTLLKFTISSTS